MVAQDFKKATILTSSTWFCFYFLEDYPPTGRYEVFATEPQGLRTRLGVVDHGKFRSAKHGRNTQAMKLFRWMNRVEVSLLPELVSRRGWEIVLTPRNSIKEEVMV